MTKKDLLDSLAKFEDDDAVVIEIHDMVCGEDLYTFYVDPIHMGLDENNEDRGHELRLSILPNAEHWYEAYVDLGDDEGTMTVESFDDSYPLLLWYAKLPEDGITFEGVEGTFKKSDISVDAWGKRLPDGQPEKSHNLF